MLFACFDRAFSDMSGDREAETVGKWVFTPGRQMALCESGADDKKLAERLAWTHFSRDSGEYGLRRRQRRGIIAKTSFQRSVTSVDGKYVFISYKVEEYR